MKRLDIEGIRERHERDLSLRIIGPKATGMDYVHRQTQLDRGNLIIEVTRLRGELKPLRKIYNAVNLMLNELGAYGEITTMHDTVSDLMDELHDFDGGVYTRIDLEQTK